MATLLNQLKGIVNQIDDRGCCSTRCPQMSSPSFPFLQVCMLDPPCAVVPTEPKYVKPLQMPAPASACSNEVYDNEVEGLRTRAYNFYNNYNIDYHKTGHEFDYKPSKKRNLPYNATTVGGTFPNCPEDLQKNRTNRKMACPTGFKPCQMQLSPPPQCHPLGTWCASIRPCSPKARHRARECGTAKQKY
ncbi:hypothetical protein PPYR_11629 [Photinus pyralis]|uniref:Uncharacterized protein n=1 Tax=Photinus pyralis TaxID=7054 RepID=A0A1Y1KJT7_PHOPY|nr:uncharacterized protein LOC116176904 [Photinus pyralis]KAB0794790.1 hypothetical protein PPYR_11629 [Photinus pyralis]